MDCIRIIGGPCQRGQEFELAAEAYSITLSEGRIDLSEGLAPGDLLIVRRGGRYVFCGSSSPEATLNRESASQRRLVNGDELRVGPFRLAYETDAPPDEVGPRAVGFDWFRAMLCSFGMVLLLMLLLFFAGGLVGGSGDSGEGSGMTQNGEGEGDGTGSGIGDGEGPGGGFGDEGMGPGAGVAGGGTGAGSSETGTELAGAAEPPATEAAAEPAGPPAQSPGTTEIPEPEPAPATPPPPPAVQKFAILSPGVATPTAPNPVARGGLTGERGGGGQILGTGDVQITLRWDTAPDVDLHVTDPNGEEIWFQHTRSGSGGTLDVDDTQFEGPENVFWPTGGAPRGNFKVDVVLFAGQRANWWVRTRIDGVEKIYKGTLTGQGRRQNVIEFSR